MDWLLAHLLIQPVTDFVAGVGAVFVKTERNRCYKICERDPTLRGGRYRWVDTGFSAPAGTLYMPGVQHYQIVTRGQLEFLFAKGVLSEYE